MLKTMGKVKVNREVHALLYNCPHLGRYAEYRNAKEFIASLPLRNFEKDEVCWNYDMYKNGFESGRLQGKEELRRELKAILGN